ncbi:hypothetical protein N9J84_01515 [Porticoccaceae bacterium]|nr:hypothetical protein [Porticoccaceae bacterium]
MDDKKMAVLNDLASSHIIEADNLDFEIRMLQVKSEAFRKRGHELKRILREFEVQDSDAVTTGTSVTSVDSDGAITRIEPEEVWATEKEE